MPAAAFPKRWEIAILLFFGITICYTLRVNISVAVEKMKDDLDWSDFQKSCVLSSFYWGYALGQLPSALYVQHYGFRTLFGLSVLIPSVLTMTVPFACKRSYGLALVIRALIGLFESATFPGMVYFILS